MFSIPWFRRRRRLSRPVSFRLAVEALEDRFLPSTYTVTTTKDLVGDTTPGEVTLRDALTAINTQAPSGNAIAGTSSNTIRFAIGAAGSVQTIKVGSGNVAAALPGINRNVFIDGWSQGGSTYSGPPLIVLNGASAGASANGLEFDAAATSSSARGLVIQLFTANGIECKGASGVRLTGNYIGTDVSGVSPLGNGNDGILVDAGAKNTIIGGTTAGAGNVISGNGNAGAHTGNGIEITGATTSLNSILGNKIGTDKTGSVALGNGGAGVRVAGGSTGNTIGGTDPGAANIVCGSLNLPTGGVPGVQAAVFALSSATITGNIARFDVSVNYTDAAPRQLVYAGVDIRNSSLPLAPVNAGTGKRDFSAFNFIPSKNIGTNWGPVANAFPGEFLFHTPISTSGPVSPLPPNASYLLGTLTYDLSKFNISPSPLFNVSILGTDTVVGSQIVGQPPTFNFITPTFTVGSQPLVGGGTTAGIVISGAGTNTNTVLGNLIGTNAQGTATLGTLGKGILIDGGASATTVGGTTPAAANIVAGSGDGIDVSGTGTTGTAILGNRIGTNAGGTLNLGNTFSGVIFENGASTNSVGGTATGSGNTIAFNGKGVVVGNSPTDTTTVGDSILGNSIYSNTTAPISLGNQSATPNGANPRPLPNHGQNTPLISAVALTGVTGILSSVASTTYRIEVFATPTAGTAQTFLGFLNVITNSSGTVNFTLPVSTLPQGAAITATATRLATGDTSESSPAGTQLLVTSAPTVASSTSSQTITLSAQVLSGFTPVVGSQVRFTIAGIPGFVIGTTNASGIVTVSFVIPAGTKPGQYAIVATLLGGENETIATGVRALTITTPVLPPVVTPVARRWTR